MVIENLKEALYEIKGVMLEKAMAHTVTLEELNRFNRAAKAAFEVAEAIEMYLERVKTEETENTITKNTLAEGNEKLVLLLEICGMTQWGIERMIAYPVKFLKGILKILVDEGLPVRGDEWFSAIEQVYRWIQLMVERDIMNVNSGKLHKQLYKDGDGDVKELALQCMKVIAAESHHLLHYIGKNTPTHKLREISEDYWYGKLSADHLIGKN
jgi:hypothetical protein